MTLRQQSAMEYLMTYGWSIVAIAVVVGALYSLGVFGGGANGATGCGVVAGFSCTQPILYSSGVLTAGVGSIGTTKTVTATGCSKNSTSPTIWESTNITLQSGQSSSFTFLCPGVQGSRIGAAYQATLWIKYSSGSQSGIAQVIAEVRTTVTGNGIPGIPAGTPYVPVNLANQRSSPTPGSFQQMITITNPSSYTGYEASDLGNIRFYQGGQELYSWCESSCSSGSAAVFWVLLPGGIGANSNTTIYMVFEPNTIEYDTVYAGECQSCSIVTGQYDNGGRVFLYYNPAPSSLSLIHI